MGRPRSQLLVATGPMIAAETRGCADGARPRTGTGRVRVAYDSACSANEEVQAAEYNEMRMAAPLGWLSCPPSRAYSKA